MTIRGLHCFGMLVVVVLMSACSSRDCPVQNIVSCVYQVSSNDSANASLPDTLNIYVIRADGTDSLLLNRSVNTNRFELPMSHTRAVDTLLFERSTRQWVVMDTVYVAKDNHPRFESVDCQLSYFHTITSVSCTQWGIDSVHIHQTSVNYDASTPHLFIYFKNLP